jgi:hypothetical protein
MTEPISARTVPHRGLWHICARLSASASGLTHLAKEFVRVRKLALVGEHERGVAKRRHCIASKQTTRLYAMQHVPLGLSLHASAALASLGDARFIGWGRGEGTLRGRGEVDRTSDAVSLRSPLTDVCRRHACPAGTSRCRPVQHPRRTRQLRWHLPSGCFIRFGTTFGSSMTPGRRRRRLDEYACISTTGAGYRVCVTRAMGQL